MGFRNGKNRVNMELLDQYEENILSKYRDYYDEYSVYRTNYPKANDEVRRQSLFAKDTQISKDTQDSMLIHFNDIWNKSNIDIGILNKNEINYLKQYGIDRYEKYCQFKDWNASKDELESVVFNQKKFPIVEPYIWNSILEVFEEIRQKYKDNDFIMLYDNGYCYSVYCLNKSKNENIDIEDLKRVVFRGLKYVKKDDMNDILNVFEQIRLKSFPSIDDINNKSLIEINIPAPQPKLTTNDRILEHAETLVETDLERILVNQIIRLNRQVNELIKSSTKIIDKVKDDIIDENGDYITSRNPLYENIASDLERMGSLQNQEEDLNSKMENKQFEFSIVNDDSESVYNFTETEITSSIKEILEKKGLKQTWLQEKTGISKSTMYTILTNTKSISLENALKISIVLGEPVDEIFDFRNNYYAKLKTNKD